MEKHILCFMNIIYRVIITYQTVSNMFKTFLTETMQCKKLILFTMQVFIEYLLFFNALSYKLGMK